MLKERVASLLQLQFFHPATQCPVPAAESGRETRLGPAGGAGSGSGTGTPPRPRAVPAPLAPLQPRPPRARARSPVDPLIRRRRDGASAGARRPVTRVPSVAGRGEGAGRRRELPAPRGTQGKWLPTGSGRG